MLEDIKTIVVLMMENRSFDHVLGHLSLPQYGGRGDVEGLANIDTDPRFANIFDQQVYRPFPMADGPLPHDLPHSRAEIQAQMAPRGATFAMSGFVESYVALTKTAVLDPAPMGYLTPDAVVMSRFLADNFLVCDHWFSPLPADTHPNRVMAFTGSSLIDDTKTRIIPHRDLVFSWLTAHGVRWRLYHCGFSFFPLFGDMALALGDNVRNFRRFAADLATEAEDEAPQVIVIEPEYGDSPVHFGFSPNDNHPPLPIGPGENFIREVYTALLNSPRWPGTLLVVIHDEHGGFFDHVPPAPIKSAPPPGALYTEPFVSTGVRVPALIASPHVERGRCYKGTLDHTSVLQLLAEKFAGSARAYSDGVTMRLDQGIESLSRVLAPTARTDRPAAPSTPIAALQLLHTTRPALTENEKALVYANKQLLAHDRDRAIQKFPELLHLPE
ncbi:MAG: alkaline phosphatase family protein [Alphaproteobacteria bacterium]